jgi:hypothetical protein
MHDMLLAVLDAYRIQKASEDLKMSDQPQISDIWQAYTSRSEQLAKLA